MRYQVSTFHKIDGKWVPTQAIGSAYQTREAAEKKLVETWKAFEVFARYFHYDIDEIPDTPVPEQPPLAKHCIVTDKFREGHGHPFSLFVNYTCPVCNQFHRIALDNIPGPGDRIVQCECGKSITLPLAFDILKLPDKPQAPQVANGNWGRRQRHR